LIGFSRHFRLEVYSLKNLRDTALIFCIFIGFAAPSIGFTLMEFKNGEKWEGNFLIRDGKLEIAGKMASIPDIKQIIFGAGVSGSSSLPLSAQDTSKALEIASAARKFVDKFPDAGGIILADENKFVYHSDGRHSVQVYFLGLVKKEDHKKWADQAFNFTEGRDRIKIKVARSIDPQGTVFNADPGKFKTSKPEAGLGVFVKYLQTSFRIPGVEVGSLVEVEYELETYNPFKKEFFFPQNYFQSTDPLFKSRFEVEIPKTEKLFWEARNMPGNSGEPEKIEKENSKVFAWELREIPPCVPEPQMPIDGDAIPYVQCSLFEGWEPVSEWINNYWKANTTPSPEIASQVAEIVKGILDEEEKIAKIFHWLQKNIRYVIIKGDASTIFGSYPAQETLRRQFGCCVDKAIVFSAMLNVLGVKNGPLLINAGGQEMSKRIPNLNISHSISRITRKDGTKFYLDSTGHDFRYPSLPTVDQGRLCLDPFDKTMDFIPMQAPEANLNKSVSSITLTIDGTINVKTRKIFTGETEASVRIGMKSMKPTERIEFLTNQINSFGQGVKLLDFKIENLDDIEKPLFMTYEYTLSSYPREIANLAVLKVPGFLESLKFPEVALASRSYPIQYETTWAREEEGTFSVPEPWKIRSVPESLNIDNSFFKFKGEYRKKDCRTFEYLGSFSLISKKVPLSCYSSFQEDLNKIERFAKERIFLERDIDSGNLKGETANEK